MNIENLTPRQMMLGNTIMTGLGLSSGFNKHFLGNAYFDPKNMLTLFEFMKINPGFSGGRIKYLVCCKPEMEFFFPTPTLFEGRAHSRELKKFLLEEGFDGNFWPPLMPKKIFKEKENFSVDRLGIERFSSLPICNITGMSRSCQPYYFLLSFLKEKGNPVSIIAVGDLLPVEKDMIFSTSIEDTRFAVKTFSYLQKKLKGYGLTEDHGPFMSIEF